MTRSLRVLLFLVAFAPLAAGAEPVTYSWTGTLADIAIDVPPSLWNGLPLGTPFEGDMDYDDDCPGAACTSSVSGSNTTYLFADGSAELRFDGSTLSHGSGLTPVFTVRIQNDAPVNTLTAETLTRLLGTSIAPGTLVDTWSVSSQQDGDVRRTFGVSYYSFDTSLWDNGDFRARPPSAAQVDAVTFGVVEGAFANFYFGSGFATDVSVPEPGPVALLLTGALVLGGAACWRAC